MDHLTPPIPEGRRDHLNARTRGHGDTLLPTTDLPTTFAGLGVPSSICDALEARGIIRPFAIQAATVADALAGRDVCGRAPTGSGKTLAFGIPLVATVDRARPGRPRGLVLAPTRELAEQISTELRSFAGAVRIGVVYGGVGYGPQFKAMRSGVDVLVACPGRLVDLIDQGVVELTDVDQVVIDEADRMADMGFLPVVRRLLDQTSRPRQTVLFSATLDGDVAKLTRDHQVDPVRHEVGEEIPDITAATHLFWQVERSDRVALTTEVVDAAWPTIVFCRTRHGADRLAKQLGRGNVKAAAIHGARSQNQRTRALADFTDGRVHALVATDVAARGIHVDGVASVVHFDPPEDHKAYVHRSGRTARAGRAGVVISLVQPEQKKGSRQLQRDVGLDRPMTQPDLPLIRDLTPPAATSPTPVDVGDQPTPAHRPGTDNRRRKPDHRGRPGQVRNRKSGKPSQNRNRKPGGERSSNGKPGGTGGGKPGQNRNRNGRNSSAGGQNRNRAGRGRQRPAA